MFDLHDFRYFVEVAKRGSFAKAARALGLPTSTISYRIQQLEKQLGVVLLARTSRSVSMTDAGEEFRRHADAVLERAEQARAAMRRRLDSPSGTVRYTASVATSIFAMPGIVSSFLEAHPSVNVVEQSNNSQIDIVGEGFDLAIRAHSADLPDSGLMQRPLADVPWFLFAAPSYLDAHGTPAHPDELQGHATLFMKRDNVAPSWRLASQRREKREHVTVPLTPRMHGECMVTLKAAASAGLGVVALPAYVARDELACGKLRRALPDWLAAESRLTAILPERRGMSVATRAFLDHLVARLPAAVRLEA